MNNTIPDRIEKLLTTRGVEKRGVRKACAAECGISYEAVRQWFTGDTQNISPTSLARIAKKWRGDLHWLITGEGAMDETLSTLSIMESPKYYGHDPIMAALDTASLTDDDKKLIAAIITRMAQK